MEASSDSVGAVIDDDRVGAAVAVDVDIAANAVSESEEANVVGVIAAGAIHVVIHIVGRRALDVENIALRAA